MTQDVTCVPASSGGNPEHTYRRPVWACRGACETEWPCEPAKTSLREQYRLDPLALFVYLGVLLEHAAGDLHKLNPNPGPDPIELHNRFIGWVPVNRMIRRALVLRGYSGQYPAPRGSADDQRSS